LKKNFEGSGYGYASHDAVRIKRWVCHSNSWHWHHCSRCV